AASRTIQPPEKAKFEEMIQRIVFTKLKSGQLDDSGLTLEDMKILFVRMADTLVNMYHGRIKYPWQEQQEREGARGGPIKAGEKVDEEAARKAKSSKEKPN